MFLVIFSLRKDIEYVICEIMFGSETKLSTSDPNSLIKVLLQL